MPVSEAPTNWTPPLAQTQCCGVPALPGFCCSSLLDFKKTNLSKKISRLDIPTHTDYSTTEHHLRRFSSPREPPRRQHNSESAKISCRDRHHHTATLLFALRPFQPSHCARAERRDPLITQSCTLRCVWPLSGSLEMEITTTVSRYVSSPDGNARVLLSDGHLSRAEAHARLPLLHPALHSISSRCFVQPSILVDTLHPAT